MSGQQTDSAAYLNSDVPVYYETMSAGLVYLSASLSQRYCSSLDLLTNFKLIIQSSSTSENYSNRSLFIEREAVQVTWDWTVNVIFSLETDAS